MTKFMAELALKLARDVKMWQKASGAANKYVTMPWHIQKKKDFLHQMASNRYKIKDIGQIHLPKGEYVPKTNVLLERARKVALSPKSSPIPNKRDLAFLEHQDKKYGMLRNVEDPTYDAHAELGVLGEALKRMGN